jgi:signal transduction histidine kinase/CheY-like chemotaxis protein
MYLADNLLHTYLQDNHKFIGDIQMNWITISLLLMINIIFRPIDANTTVSPLLETNIKFEKIISNAHVYLINENTNHLIISDHLSYLKDKSHQLRINDVCKPPISDNFLPLNQRIVNMGFSDDTFWFKFRLRYQPRNVFVLKEWYLEIGYPLLDEVVLYYPVEDKDYIVKKTGRKMRKSPADIHYKNPIFRLYTKPFQDYELFIKIRSSSTIQAPVQLWSPGTFSQNVARENFIWGIFFGIMFVMAIYNAFIYIVVKDHSYLYYVFYILSFLCLLSSFKVNGFLQMPESFTWWGHGSIPFFICFAGFWMTRFSKHYLKTNDYSPFRGFVLDCVMIGNLLIALFSFVISYSFAVKLAAFYILLNALLLLMSAIICYTNNGEQARYYLIAWAALLSGIIMYSLKTFAVLPSNYITTYSLPIGATLEVILLSLGLAQRINTDRREKIIAQKEALKAKSLSLVAQEKTNQELKKAGIVKSTIISNISNEVRTPLHAMMGMANLLKKTDLSKGQKRFIHELIRAGEGLFQVTNDLVDYARLESHRLKLHHTVFELNKCINETCDLFESVAKKKSIRLERMIDNRLPEVVSGDISRIRQIISNLLENAFKYTEQGEIIVEVHNWSDEMNATHSLNLRPLTTDECFVYFSVKDTGTGIDKETQDELFNLFTKKDTERIGNQTGFGLGLSICRRLVQLMKGAIWVKSQLDKGSAFHFVISLKRAGTEQLAINRKKKKKKSILATEFPALKVLLAEDNPHNQLVIKMMFENSPFSLDIVENGKQAVLNFSEHTYDLVIMDILMPLMNGIEAITQIRTMEKQKKLPETPILVVTADSRPTTYKACKKAGCSDFMNKPIMDQKQFFARILNIVNKTKG